MNATADFVVAWNSLGQDGSSSGVFGRMFNLGGNPSSAEFQVNTYTTSYQRLPAVSMNTAGDFVVAWNTDTSPDADYGVYAQRFDSAGVPQGIEFHVNTHTPEGLRV